MPIRGELIDSAPYFEGNFIQIDLVKMGPNMCSHKVNSGYVIIKLIQDVSGQISSYMLSIHKNINNN